MVCLWILDQGFGIRNPNSTDKESEIQYLESRIQDCLELPYMGLLTLETQISNLRFSFTVPILFQYK